jgi:hypothetical protein
MPAICRETVTKHKHAKRNKKDKESAATKIQGGRPENRE